MLRRTVIHGGSVHRAFESLGRLVVRRPISIIAAWIALLGALFLLIDPLFVVAQKNPPDLLPKDSLILASGELMKNAFKEADGGNAAIVVLTNDKGLQPGDEDTDRMLVGRLKGDTKNIKSTQEFIAIPELREAMTSKDKKAWILPISVAGNMGTGGGQAAYGAVLREVKDATAGSDLTVNVVGASATFADLNDIGASDQTMIEISTILTIFTILVIVYRNMVAMLMPLITIGISMTGMKMGAGVDYAVFLFSRCQECIRAGMNSDDAVVTAISTIGEVVAGSAATVALTFMGLCFTTLGVFLTVGPSLAATILVAVLGALTILPSLMVLAGRREWIKPRRDITRPFWRRTAFRSSGGRRSIC